jgi:hypothetical protein
MIQVVLQGSRGRFMVTDASSFNHDGKNVL